MQKGRESRFDGGVGVMALMYAEEQVLLASQKSGKPETLKVYAACHCATH